MSSATPELPERPAPPRDAAISFLDPHLLDTLAALPQAAVDRLPFGIISLDSSGAVVAYNANEQRRAGLDAADVVGHHFFSEIAPCTDNSMVRGRFVAAWDSGADLDERLPYTFCLRMKPTRVTLRLLVRGARGWLLVQGM